MYVDNIISTWFRASAEQLDAGRRWYHVAHTLATALSPDDPRRGAGVLAALSPQTPWTRNVVLATRAVANGQASGHTGDACRKADRILAGECPMSVLPRDSKTWNFARVIADPADEQAVVIDRHAADIALGKRHGNSYRGNLRPTGRLYRELIGAYREAARQLGESPSTVQAVTWVVWREES